MNKIIFILLELVGLKLPQGIFYKVLFTHSPYHHGKFRCYEYASKSDLPCIVISARKMTGIRLPLCIMHSALLNIVFILQNQNIIFGLYHMFYGKNRKLKANLMHAEKSMKYEL